MHLFGDDGIITKAAEASEKAKLAEYKETVDTYVVSKLADGIEATKINFGRQGDEGVETVIKSITDFYKERMVIMRGVLYYCYFPEDGEDGTENICNWCKQIGIEVIEYGNFVYDPLGSEFALVKDSSGESEYYICTPDLSGFNPNNTYYISYTDVENINTVKIMSRIDRVYTFTNTWYDYTQKYWANIMTINDTAITYWVWIPRYAYRVIGEGETASVETVFVDTENKYYDTTIDKMMDLTDDWTVSEAFTFDGVELGGYWISKYEVQENTGNNNTFYCTGATNSLCVRTSDSTNKETYKVYVEGTLVYTGDLSGSSCVISQIDDSTLITESTTYLVEIYDSDSVRKWMSSVTTLKAQDTDEVNNMVTVDVSGFWANNGTSDTKYYFVLYDSTGANPILVPFPTTSDSGNWSKNQVNNYLSSYLAKGYVWYSYSDKIWANVVSVANGTITYWTYIPRYAYYQVGGSNSGAFDIRFIGKDYSVADLDWPDYFVIPESFTFDGKALHGYWISKYEVENTELPDEINVAVDSNKIVVKGKNNSSKFDVYVYDNTNTLKWSSTSGNTGTITSDVLAYSTEYTVKVYYYLNGLNSSGSSTTYKLEVYNGKVTTAASSSGTENIQVDLSGFSSSNKYLYYVIYDSSGKNPTVGSRITFGEDKNANNVPTNWYNYDSKIWANIIASDSALSTGTSVSSLENTKGISMWVYIPRYEYKIDESTGAITIKFISGAKEENWILPESFSFDSKTLKGYWISKYELQDQEAKK